ncbi:hypothetical protein [Leptolyngbya sp. 7M]|nr:hypothetical protein [Leptolyngbya sp. 7M]
MHFQQAGGVKRAADIVEQAVGLGSSGWRKLPSFYNPDSELSFWL